ncbi:MAG TPA: NAD(P)H-quinone oxidoreductase [Terriglobales bacterium]|nr:NAD(P)H-quinone oxidoreductase [Terriglobales bacterium]
MNTEQMLAAVISRPGGPEVLELRTVPRPQPESTEILVRVRASALNRADLLQRRGHYPAPPGAPTDIPGLEFAGEVEQIGSVVQLWKPGNRVMGLTGGGAHAGYLVAHERAVMEIPRSLTWEQAAAIPEAFITAHDALWIQAALRANEQVLIHAVSSGVGLAALQLTRAMGAIPSGTSRTADKLVRAKEFGLESGFLVPASPTTEEGRKWAADRAFDVVLDLAGGSYLNASLQALAHRGRIVLIGTMAGAKSEIDLGLMLGKRVRMIGTVLRARPLEEKIAVTRSFAREVLPFFESKVLHVVIDSEFPFQDIRKAHERMESNQTFGKIVLRMSD